MNVKKVFNESSSQVLTKKKADYLKELEENAKEVIDDKKKELNALLAIQDKYAAKISAVGQAVTFDEFVEKSGELGERVRTAQSILRLEVKIKNIEAEISDLEAAFKELFG